MLDYKKEINDEKFLEIKFLNLQKNMYANMAITKILIPLMLLAK